MNATVITRPRCIIETATASMNCRSVSQWNWRLLPVQERHDREPAANTKRLASEIRQDLPEDSTDAGPPRLAAIPERPAEARERGRRSRQPSSSSIGTSPHTRKTR